MHFGEGVSCLNRNILNLSSDKVEILLSNISEVPLLEVQEAVYTINNQRVNLVSFLQAQNPLASFNYVNFQTFKSVLKPQSQQTKGNQRSCLVKTEMNYAF